MKFPGVLIDTTIKELLEQDRPGATIIPLIISTDKTQVTMFRNKSAYPVYLTLGNIPKAIRRKPSMRAQILLAYLPTTKLEHITNKAARRRAVTNLFHSCMDRVFAPLETAGVEGIIMSTGDGVKYRCHPIVAAYAADYQDQYLVAGTKSGECPKCDVPPDHLGCNDITLHPRDLKKARAALALADDNPTLFVRACVEAGIKPIYRPFWLRLPFLNIYRAITPDILHQILQGILRHLISWLKAIFGPNELDLRCKCLPPNHNIRLFLNGITGLSKVTGKEHDEMARILLGLIVDLRLPNNQNPVRLIRAVRALLDFLYLAQYPVHTNETLRALDDALNRFHANKEIFVDLGVQEAFKIPKLHSLRHYNESIKLFGTTDNYNTQATERLHIDYAKDAYRATNAKDEYPQMTRWMERQEKLFRHAHYISWRLSVDHHIPSQQTPVIELKRLAVMPKHPSVRSVTLNTIITEYGATYIREAIARFIATGNHPDWTQRQIEDVVVNTFLPFRAVPVFHKMKFVSQQSRNSVVVDTIHAQPARQSRRRKCSVSGRFDTALINVQEGENIGVQGILPIRSMSIHYIYTGNVRSSRCTSPSHFQSSPHCHYTFRTTP